jgi:hypothetical protein
MATEIEVLEGPGRRINPALIVVLAVILLGAVFFFVVKPLFFGENTATPTAPPAATSVIKPSVKPSPTPAAPPPETFEVFESKDPFRPLVSEGGAAGGTTSTGTTAGTTSAGAAGAPAPSGGQQVSVVDVFTDNGVTKAQVKVGSTVFTVAPGDTFATTFKLVSISGNCATMLNGDDKFTLCKGEEVIK